VSSSPWKTGAPVTRSKPIARPGPGLVLRQLLTAVLIAVLWGAVLVGYTQLVGVQVPTPAAASSPRATRTRSPRPAPTAVVAAVTPPATATSPAASPAAVAAAGNTPAPATSTPAAARPATTATTAPQAGAVSFSKDVLPIFESVCVKCHGGEKTEVSLVLKSYADVMAGSENGPVIDPGKSADSLLIELITNGKMPKRGTRLLPAQLRIITQWVDAGAPNN
jgi:mono/diheme cytochrome c family protein